MPIPLIPVISALAAGGTFVPHAAGGLIISSTAGGYVTGTYLSTAAIASILTWGSAGVATGAAAITGAATSIIGGAGIFGTTVGATGITGALMSAGLIASTPVYIPILAVGGVVAGGVLLTYAYRIRELKQRIKMAGSNAEIQFTDADAKLFERFLKALHKKRGKQ